MRTALSALGLAGCFWAEISHGQSGKGSDEPSVFIEVQSDGQHCVVRKVTLTCADVLTHLRQVLKLPPGTWVRFKAGRSVPYDAVKRVIDEVQHSEYATSVAYLTPPKGGSK